MAEHNIFIKMILKDHPDYDLERYRFKAGDVVRLNCGALLLVDYSAIEYASGYICRKSVLHRELKEERVSYDELPYFKEDEFVPYKFKLNTSLKWKVGDFIRDDRGTLMYLYHETDHQCFYGFVLESAQSYYLHTRVFVMNPYREFVLTGSK